MRLSAPSVLVGVAAMTVAAVPGAAHAATAVPATAPAAAADSQVKVVASPASSVSTASVLKYWTKKRMAKAKPLMPHLETGAVDGADVSASAVVNAKIRPNPKLPLNRTTGRLYFTRGGTNYYCSATVTTAGNKRSVWTAGHCVHGGRGSRWNSNGMFVPAFHNGKAPFGKWVVDRWITNTGWTSNPTPRAFAYDIGAFTVRNQGKRKLQKVVGGKPVKLRPVRKLTVLDLGYPLEFLPSRKRTNPNKMYYCQGKTYRVTIKKGFPVGLGLQCTMGGGSSGGGWLHRYGKVWHIVGLNSAHSTTTKRMISPWHGEAARVVLKKVRSYR